MDGKRVFRCKTLTVHATSIVTIHLIFATGLQVLHRIEGSLLWGYHQIWT